LCLVTAELRALTMAMSLAAQPASEAVLSSLAASGLARSRGQSSLLLFPSVQCAVLPIPKAALLSRRQQRVRQAGGVTNRQHQKAAGPGGTAWICSPSFLPTGTRNPAGQETPHSLPSTPPHPSGPRHGLSPFSTTPTGTIFP